MPTGDPNCPPHIQSAKRIHRKIIKATVGSDGESGGGDLGSDGTAGDDEVDDVDDRSDGSNGSEREGEVS